MRARIKRFELIASIGLVEEEDETSEVLWVKNDVWTSTDYSHRIPSNVCSTRSLWTSTQVRLSSLLCSIHWYMLQVNLLSVALVDFNAYVKLTIIYKRRYQLNKQIFQSQLQNHYLHVETFN